MTREEIIEGLKLLEDNMVYFDELLNDKGEYIDVNELLFEAIEVLEQEPTTKENLVVEDCISREAVQNYVESHIQEINTGYGDLNKHTNEILRMIVDYIEKMESVTPQPEKHTEERTKTHACDCISRQAVLEIQAKYAEYVGATKFWQMRDDIKALPPVTPKPKTDVLDKIRAEIEQEYNRLSATRDETLELGECLGLKMSLKIIDKYKTESEGKE